MNPLLHRTLPPLLFAAVISSFGVGCKTPQEELVGEPTPFEEPVGEPRTTNIKLEPDTSDRPRQPEAELTVMGWPYNEPGRTFELTWTRGKTTLQLLESASLNSDSARSIAVTKNDTLFWTESAVAVYEPSSWRVRKAVTIEGYRWGNEYRTGDDIVSADLLPGSLVELYHYAGQGMCIVKVKGQLIEAMCPDASHFDGRFVGEVKASIYQPRKSVWWVRLRSEGGDGWLPLDDRVAVDIVD